MTKMSVNYQSIFRILLLMEKNSISTSTRILYRVLSMDTQLCHQKYIAWDAADGAIRTG